MNGPDPAPWNRSPVPGGHEVHVATTHTMPARNSRARLYYTGASITALLIVFLGFAKTYYLKGAFGAPALTGLVHAHGFVMSSWFLLFFLQVRLVAAHRTDLHRRLGVAGAILAATLLLLGAATAIAAARKGVTPGPPPLVFLAIPFGDLAVFAGLISTGLALRRHLEFHRRLMLLSCFGILTPAIARVPLTFIETGGPLVYFGLTDLCILLVVAIDTVRNRRLHPAFLWGTIYVIASQPARIALAGTGAWLRFATWLTS